MKQMFGRARQKNISDSAEVLRRGSIFPRRKMGLSDVVQLRYTPCEIITVLLRF